MNKYAHPYHPVKTGSRLRKRGKTLLIQFIVCILLVIMIICIKKADFAISNRVVETFATQIQKDADITTMFNAGVKKAGELQDAFRTVSTRILNDNSTFAFNEPVESVQTVPVFANDGRQVGIDYQVSDNELQVYTAGAGTVTEIGTSDKVGKYIKINHGKDVFTIYGHCSTIYVEPMDKVKRGDLIASVASTPDTVFRFEIYKDGKAVNPNDYIKTEE